MNGQRWHSSPSSFSSTSKAFPTRDFDYLVGVMVKKGDKTTMHSFWADGPDGEADIFKECLALAAKYPNAPIYHYGNYERRAIERVAEQHGLDCQALLRSVGKRQQHRLREGLFSRLDPTG